MQDSEPAAGSSQPISDKFTVTSRNREIPMQTAFNLGDGNQIETENLAERLSVPGAMTVKISPHPSPLYDAHSQVQSACQTLFDSGLLRSDVGSCHRRVSTRNIPPQSKRFCPVEFDKRALPHGNNLQIFVKALTGRTILLDVRLSMTIDDIKNTIESRLDIPAHDQRLVYAGKQLQGSHSLFDYNIQHEATIHLLLSLRGGQGVTLDIIKQYSPVFRFHPNEPSLPCSIEYLLQGATLNFRNFSFASQIAGVQSSKPFSIVPFKDRLYMAYISSNGSQLKLSKSQSGSSWANWDVITQFPSVSGAAAPSLAVFQDQLWVIYSIPKLSQLWITHSGDGQIFSNAVKLASPAASLAVIAAFQGSLFMVYRKGKSPDLWMTQSSDGTDWPTPHRIDGQQAIFPALAVFQDHIVMAYPNPANGQLFVSRYNSASGWTAKSQIRDNVLAVLSLTVAGDHLCMVYSDRKTSQLKVSRSVDGSTWSNPVDIPSQMGGNVATSFISNNLVIVYSTPKNSTLWFTQCPGGDIEPHPPMENVTQAMLREHNTDHFYIKVNPSQHGGQPIPNAPLYYAVQEFEDGVEIAYLLLYAYQPAQTALARRLGSPFYCSLPNLGTHEGDFERLAVRLRPGPNDTFTVHEVCYEAHGDANNNWFAHDKVLQWEDETHPIVHVALNSHAMRNLNPDVLDHHWDVTNNIPGVVAVGDWVGNGQWWRPHHDGSEFKRLGLDHQWQPISDQVWSAFGGRLGDTHNNTLVEGLSFNGRKLSRSQWAFVKLIYWGGMLIKKIPVDKFLGDAPTGPAQRGWDFPGGGKLFP